MNKSIKRWVAIALLLFTFTVPATTFAMTNEGQIENQSESIYEPQKEEFEKMLKDDVFTPSKEEIPYQDVPRIPVSIFSLNVFLARILFSLLEKIASRVELSYSTLKPRV